MILLQINDTIHVWMMGYVLGYDQVTCTVVVTETEQGRHAQKDFSERTSNRINWLKSQKICTCSRKRLRLTDNIILILEFIQDTRNLNVYPNSFSNLLRNAPYPVVNNTK